MKMSKYLLLLLLWVNLQHFIVINNAANNVHFIIMIEYIIVAVKNNLLVLFSLYLWIYYFE